MHIDAGVDTGSIIHQIRPTIHPLDTPSQIGNRFIIQMTQVYSKLVLNFDKLEPNTKILSSIVERKVYKNKDYSSKSVHVLYENIKNGMLEKYLDEQEKRCKNVPIIINKTLQI